MIGKFGFLAVVATLGACATQSPAQYGRVDGRPLDNAQMRAVLAQCRGEGAASVVDYVGGEGMIPWAAGVASRSSKEATIVNACMARNGYLAH